MSGLFSSHMRPRKTWGGGVPRLGCSLAELPPTLGTHILEAPRCPMGLGLMAVTSGGHSGQRETMD